MNTKGKTHVALHHALLKTINEGAYRHVKVVRPPVSINDMGHLPGTAEEKMKPYTDLYADIINYVCGRGDAAGILVKKDIFSAVPTSFEQGKTYYNTFVIVDEVENMRATELDMIITRCGEGSAICFCGDLRQAVKGSTVDGLRNFTKLLLKMPSATFVEYNDPDEIVRHGFVGEYIKAREDLL